MVIRPEQQRYLRANHAQTYPQRMLFLDTETRQSVVASNTRHTLDMAWTCYVRMGGPERMRQEDWRYWEDAESLCRYIESRVSNKKALYLFGHNIYFDLQAAGFFRMFPEWGWRLDFSYDQGITYLLIIHKDKASIKIISTTNYFDYPLRELGKIVGLPKLDVEFGVTQRPEMKAYCRRDVEITVAAMRQYLAFNKKHDTGNFRMTKGSQAFTAFRHRFMDARIYYHDEEAVTRLERDAYFGGRTEAFYIGRVSERDVVFLDVNSMYPYVMREKLYPVKLVYYTDNPTPGDYLRHKDTHAMIADVSLSTDEPAYAFRGDAKCLFPVGDFRTCLCTAGLLYAYERHHITSMHRLAVYERAPLFRSYVDYFYPLKAKYKTEGNDVYRELVKKYLNCLYGKLGQRITLDLKEQIPFTDITTRLDNYDRATGKHWTETIMFGVKITAGELVESRTSLCAIPAHVTEYARYHLWGLIGAIGRDRVYYCDTDSIVTGKTTAQANTHRLDASRLGSLSVDKEGQSLTIYGCKDYQLDDVRKTKGLPKTATRISEHTYQYEQFLSQASHLRRGETDAYITSRVTKRIDTPYDKGHVLPGGAVIPYCFRFS